jgi:polar amino acid transport system substrate-binding protein
MRRLAAAVVAAAVAAAAFAAWGFAARSGGAREGASGVAASAAKLPKLPPDVKARRRWAIGVKCDFPPFGFIDVQGHNAGYDVEIAQRFAQLAFGKKNRVFLICVTTPSRIPTLISKRVDIIVSTLTWTAAREQVIDYSIPYYSATGRLLVPNNSNIHSLGDLGGKTVVTTRGSIYDRWVTNCFKSTKLLVVDSPAASTLAVKDGRADAFMFDDAFLLGVATQDRDLKLTRDKFLTIPWGIGIRKGDTAMARWVNAALRLMQKRDEFVGILKRNAPKRLVGQFLGNVPRPGKSFQYPRNSNPEACP